MTLGRVRFGVVVFPGSNCDYDMYHSLELMGHRKLGGYMRVVELAGAAFVRIDVPEEGAFGAATQFYASASIYAITPTTEETGRALARGARVGRHGGFNVKLGRGGIREVEFAVQTLQLTWGGKLPELRASDTPLKMPLRVRFCAMVACRPTTGNTASCVASATSHPTITLVTASLRTRSSANAVRSDRPHSTTRSASQRSTPASSESWLPITRSRRASPAMRPRPMEDT